LRSSAAAALCAALVPAAALSASGAGTTGSVHIVQADPGVSVEVTVDGRTVRKDVAVGTVLGPYVVSSGSHVVTFTDPSGTAIRRATVTVQPGSSTDVVLHRPASVSGKAVVHTYTTPRRPIGPDKARILVAHTATVAPADVRVDGKVVFTNIANGEFAEADVPAGHHVAELLPTGQTTHPILGPIPVDLAPRTVTMVYAYGTPTNGSMNVIAHASQLRSDGTVVPGQIDTGSAGLAGSLRVTPFG